MCHNIDGSTTPVYKEDKKNFTCTSPQVITQSYCLKQGSIDECQINLSEGKPGVVVCAASGKPLAEVQLIKKLATPRPVTPKARGTFKECRKIVHRTTGHQDSWAPGQLGTRTWCWCPVVHNLVPSCPGAQLFWCSTVRCAVVLVPSCSVPNCPGVQLSWCPVVQCPVVRCPVVRCPIVPVPSCPVPSCPGAQLSGAQLSVSCPVPNCPGAQLSGAQLSVNPFKTQEQYRENENSLRRKIKPL